MTGKTKFETAIQNSALRRDAYETTASAPCQPCLDMVGGACYVLREPLEGEKPAVLADNRDLFCLPSRRRSKKRRDTYLLGSAGFSCRCAP